MLPVVLLKAPPPKGDAIKVVMPDTSPAAGAGAAPKGDTILVVVPLKLVGANADVMLVVVDLNADDMLVVVGLN